MDMMLTYFSNSKVVVPTSGESSIQADLPPDPLATYTKDNKTLVFQGEGDYRHSHNVSYEGNRLEIWVRYTPLTDTDTLMFVDAHEDLVDDGWVYKPRHFPHPGDILYVADTHVRLVSRDYKQDSAIVARDGGFMSLRGIQLGYATAINALTPVFGKIQYQWYVPPWSQVRKNQCL